MALFPRLSDKMRENRDRPHATAIEYALIAALVAIALVTILNELGEKLKKEFCSDSSASYYRQMCE